MIEIMKANDLPAGARIMGRGGRALNGAELATGLMSFVECRVSPEAAQGMQRELDLNWWPSQHLTFPNAKLEWCECKWEDGSLGIWLRVVLAHKHEWVFQWNDENADIREMQRLGPFGTPDDFREALGLPRTAQFRLPDGRVVTAELPGSALRPHDTSNLTVKFTPEDIAQAKAISKMAEVPQLVAKPGDVDQPVAQNGYVPEVTPLQERSVMEDMEVVRREAEQAVDRMEVRAREEKYVEAHVANYDVKGGFVADFSHRFKPAETASEELLAEPPKVETAPPPAEPIKPPARAGLKKSVKAGGRK